MANNVAYVTSYLFNGFKIVPLTVLSFAVICCHHVITWQECSVLSNRSLDEFLSLDKIFISLVKIKTPVVYEDCNRW